MSTEVKNTIIRVIKMIANERNLDLPDLADDTEIVDEIGFSSLMVAGLLANLEEALGVDPFQDEGVSITDLRTIGDLTDVYSRCCAAR